MLYVFSSDRRSGSHKGFRTLASKSVVSHFGGRLIEQDPSPASTRNDKPVEAITEIWANVNQPHVVATLPGYKARRAILGAIASNHVKYSTACEFVGGSLSRAAFNEAKAPRETALADGDMSKLSGTSKERSDNLQKKSPMACGREQSFAEHTQPFPNLTKTNHDYRQRGDHIRSDADNSLVCVHPEKCETHPVYYITGTRDHLFRQCMDDLQAAVRICY
ncbi:unnamed protein product [Ectocarpus sp. CCAP 1310/34]|nr:unnamed protein product [Ectocarpus sp. CCAP 1310/34]